jgi:hypothetical protein
MEEGLRTPSPAGPHDMRSRSPYISQRLDMVMRRFALRPSETPESLRDLRQGLLANPAELDAWWDAMHTRYVNPDFFITRE